MPRGELLRRSARTVCAATVLRVGSLANERAVRGAVRLVESQANLGSSGQVSRPLHTERSASPTSTAVSDVAQWQSDGFGRLCTRWGDRQIDVCLMRAVRRRLSHLAIHCQHTVRVVDVDQFEIVVR